MAYLISISPWCILEDQHASLTFGVLSQNPRLIIEDYLNLEQMVSTLPVWYSKQNLPGLSVCTLFYFGKKKISLSCVSKYKLLENIYGCKNTGGTLKNIPRSSLKHSSYIVVSQLLNHRSNVFQPIIYWYIIKLGWSNPDILCLFQFNVNV